MKKVSIKVLSLLLVIMTLVGVISLPVSASIGYPMNYTIYYKAGGKLLGQFSGSCDGTERNNVRVPSPSYDGYLLSNYKDSTVTGSMISWSFPASNYVRHGTGSYTVYYEPAYTATVRFLYGDSGRSAAGDKTATGKKGDQYYISSPRITGYSPDKYSVTGYFPSGDVSDNGGYIRMKIRNIPFGYEVVGGRYVVNNGEAEIISSIYSMYLSGKTLLGIAEALTEQEVTYFEDTKVWNKNMVSRILADERYLGNETFPRLVDSNNFNLAKNIRAEKGGKKAVLTPLMATVKDMLYCAECGETFSRINKWRTREKWLCKGKCKCSVYLDDRTICESILSVLNRAIREPNLLTAPANNTEYIGSIEVIR